MEDFLVNAAISALKLNENTAIIRSNHAATSTFYVAMYARCAQDSFDGASELGEVIIRYLKGKLWTKALLSICQHGNLGIITVEGKDSGSIVIRV